ncbi:RusA family crossover junction endodeoxyribonuclease [Methylocaldum sp.]|uniref:RusA family crossover junction endodeoxyribonuclease n=1 Tax=Methylocaldum sp. TaxID=1969727 RepID=UPI002D3FB174|nr:RusA family crossover junction endodeoxyribonuclease [Methylocaldum sp.]HYE38207.1 RusA family crossover junction endodeoxyribonuclease [Methylocaldum sp.]
MIALSLPFPPSANRLWRAVNGRNIKSAVYRVWEAECAGCILAQRIGRAIDGRYAITIDADRPDRRKRDLGNLEKAVSDALVSCGLVRDDSDADEITIRWSEREPGKGAAVHITLTPRDA